MPTASARSPAYAVGELARRAVSKWPLRALVHAILPATPFALVALHLGAAEWCFGDARLLLAIGLAGAAASALLLVSWEMHPAQLERSAALSALAAAGAAVPMLLGG